MWLKGEVSMSGVGDNDTVTMDHRILLVSKKTSASTKHVVHQDVLTRFIAICSPS